MDTASLLWGLLFGSAGMAYIMYGRKQKAPVPTVCGILLMVYPYFVSNNLLVFMIGVAFMAVPYFFRA